MVRRHYFASYVKYHNDGKGSFSYRHLTFSRSSLLAQPEEAFRDAIKHAENEMADKPGDGIHCLAFSRI